MMKDIILAKITELEEDAISLMTDLIGINAIGPKNDGPGENKKSEYLEKYLKNTGFKDIRNYRAPDPSVSEGSRPNLVALLPGNNASRTLWVMCSSR